MRRPARRLFTLCSAVSLVVCMAVAACWLRSFGYDDILLYTGNDNRVDFSVSSDRGILLLDVWSTSNHQRGRRWNLDTFPSDDGWRFSYPTGFRLGEEWSEKGGFNRAGFMLSPREKSGAIPHWFLALLASIMPAVWVLRRVRRARQHTGGLCPTCGYDLRASPDRCPECGAAPPYAATT